MLYNTPLPCEMTDILDVSLLPRPNDADIKERLARSIARATTMRAAVAYWTVGPNDVSPLLPTRLGDNGSFLCVDVHFPTDLNQIDQLNARGANVYLHLRHLGIGTETVNRGLPQHLMHTKLLLFDLDDGTSEIWVGSHNWTLRALGGPNVESSLVLHVSRESEIYADTAATLEHIHGLCRRFQHNELDQYKQLQGQQKDDGAGDPVPVIELRSRQAGNIHGAVALFGKRIDGWRDDWQLLRDIEQEVILKVTDSDNGQVFLYAAMILHSGLQIAANPNAGGLAFSKRLYAVIDGHDTPIFEGPARPPETTLHESAYFVTLQLVRPLADAHVVESLPADKRWMKTADDPLISRMRPEHLDLITSRRHRRVLMQVPAFLNARTQVNELRQEMLLPPSELASTKRHPLIAWKLLSDSTIKQ